MRTKIYQATVRGEPKHVLSSWIGATRRRFFFDTKTEAEEKLCAMEKEFYKTGDKFLWLDAAVKEELVVAQELACKAGVSVLAAVRKAISKKNLAEAKPYSATDPATGTSIHSAIYQFLEEKKQKGCRPNTLRTLVSKLTLFASDGRGKAPITSLDRPMIVQWINSNKWGTTSKNNARDGIVTFLNWCVTLKIIPENPAATIEKYVPTEEEEKREMLSAPKIIMPDKVGELFRAAAAQDAALLPYVALVFFAGLRPEREAAGIVWEKIHFKGETNSHGVVNESDYIEVGNWLAKDRQAREVPMQPALRDWLLHCRAAGHALPVHNPTVRWAKVRKSLKLTGQHWPLDAARHTYASMHLMAFQNADTTRHSMGHGNFEMLFKHYRRVLPQSTALKFWELTPGNVLG